MNVSGVLKKMDAKAENPVQYFLDIDQNIISVNELIGRTLQIEYHHKINCLHCGSATKTSFSQGYCYACFISIPQTDVGVINPELNQAHLGISRDMEWSRLNDLIDHYVYLSVTSDIKVGVTRHTQIPTRWIDQGAEYAIILAKTPYRQLAGLIEVALKDHFKDKTNWRKMLQGPVTELPDLISQKERAVSLLPDELAQYVYHENQITKIDYPVLNYPKKVTSINLETAPFLKGTLEGIKGQYLLFDNGRVINIRKYGGFNVTLTVFE